MLKTLSPLAKPASKSNLSIKFLKVFSNHYLFQEKFRIPFPWTLSPSSTKTTIVVVVDLLSKHAHFCALSSHFSAIQLADIFVKEITRLHGFPSSIISDRDPIFMSSFWRELFKLQGTMLSMSSSYHPQTDGQTEVLNRYLEDYLWSFTAENPSS